MNPLVRCLMIGGMGAAGTCGLWAAEPKKVEPFEDVLREAVKEYRAGHLDKASEALAKAGGLIDSMRSGMVVDTFPPAPEGWTVGEVEKADIPGMFGGGRTVKRLYRNKDGDQEILLEVICDSGFGKLMTGMLANDAAAEAQGFKVRNVGAERALFKKSAGGGELDIPVDERIFVKLTGKGGVGEKEMFSLARELDRRSLKQVK